MTKRTWNSQYKELSNQSSFHEAVRTIFSTDPIFSKMHCYQEVEVAELIPEYPHKGQRYDWYINEMNVVIELHGKQHYVRTNFGTTGYSVSVKNFKDMQARDSAKKLAAEEAGLLYIEIPYTMQKGLTAAAILELIQRSLHGTSTREG
jgi:hypothetical protein